MVRRLRLVEMINDLEPFDSHYLPYSVVVNLRDETKV